jgi:NitT/TauT family transport system permease protein
VIEAAPLEAAPARVRGGVWGHLPAPLRPAYVRWLLVVLVLALLEALVRVGAIRPTVIPAPTAVGQALADSFRTGEVLRALGRTAAELGISFGVAVVVGVAIGLALWRWRVAREVVQPALITLYAVPLVFFYPVLLALFGIGIGPVLVVAILTGIVPVALNTMIGLVELQPVWVKTARAFNASRRQLYTKVYFPGAAPFFFAGLRLGITYISIGVIAMEFITSDAGLGYMARYYKEQFQAPKVYAYVTVVFALAMVFDAVLRRLADRVQGTTA